MNYKIKSLIFIFLTALSFLYCGSESDNQITLSGKLNINTENRVIGDSSTTFVVISRTINFDEIQNDPLNNILELAQVGSAPYEFSIDLSKTGVAEGDKIYIFAFTTGKYVSGVPSLSTGDLLGFYINRDTFDLAYIVSNGNNSNIEIDVNREVFDFDTSVSGTVNSDSPGEVTLVAYAGSITSFDFSEIDINAVIGYKKVNQTSSTIPYTLEILPYGFNIPIDNVYIFAFQDKNGNGKPDAGDSWGIFSDEEGYPSGITITDIPSANITITLDQQITSTADYENSITGNFEAPSGYGPSSPPVFMIICKADNPDQLFNNAMDSVRYFKRLPAGATDFELDLSNSGLSAGDKVMIIAMWDKDTVSDFPHLREGNIIGYYLNETDYTYQYTLNEGTNPPVFIKLNKTYKKNSASVKGNILGPESGDVFVVAYTGEFNSLYAPIDTGKIAGYKKITKGTSPIPYSIDMFPFNTFPLHDVFLFAILDKNKNGIPDTGDSLGYYSSDSKTQIPTSFTLQDSVNGTYNIKFMMDYVKPVAEGTSMILSGSFQAPTRYTADPSSRPIFIMVAKADNTDDIFSNPMTTMKYFVKLPQGATSFDIELSGTGLVPGDPVMVIALWDHDYVSGFPYPTDGDMIGYYINNTDYTYQYVLARGSNPPVSIDLNKVYRENIAVAKGLLLGSETGDVIVVAYTGEFNSLDAKLDTDKIIGYKKITKGADPAPYALDILPFASFPVENVFIFAILDKNKNRIPDSGDRLGFYSRNQNGIPSTVTLQNTTTGGLNIEFTSDYVQPVIGALSISLSGTVTAPSGYTSDPSSKPLFVMVAKADSTSDLFSDPMSSLKYFAKLPQGATSFNIELSGTGLIPGDKVMIIALWDRDYISGFPSVSNGDITGYYTDPSSYTYDYTLIGGVNPPVSINLNRTYQTNSASVSGNVLGTDIGDVILVAYTGEFNSLDARLDTNRIIGYSRFSKGITPVAYSMEILPLTSFPAENVFIFAVLDINKNGIPDNGDRLGFYSNNQSGIPSSITIQNTATTGIDIKFTSDYVQPVTGGVSISLSGTIDAPSGYTSNPSSKPVFILVAKADSAGDLFTDPMSSLKYFAKLPQGATTFDLDLSGTGLVPGDKVMIIALWDRDYVSGFPSSSDGDMIGYYTNPSTYTYEYVLIGGVNPPVSLTLGKTYQTNNSSVTGTLLGSDSGDVILVAYTGEFNSLDAKLDTDKIVGYEKVTKGTGPLSYSMNILPLTSFPVYNVFIFAVLDKNSNGIPDSGDRLGFYSNSQTGIPASVTLQNTQLSGIDIAFKSDYTQPVTGGTSIILNGSITAPSGYTADPSSKPLFILVTSAESTSDIFNDPLASLKYFIRLPQGSTSFSIELSGTGLIPGDQVMVIALWDRDYVSGFPSASNGDMIGYYINNADYNYQYTLQAGNNPAISLAVDKTYRTNNATVAGNLLGSETGDVILVAYTGEFNSLDAKIDTNKIIGYKKVNKGAGRTPYSMDILPLSSFPVYNAFIFAILDRNANGIPDAGDRMGFYSGDSQSGIPSVVTLQDGVNSGFNIEFTADYLQPSSGGTSIILNGSFPAPSGYTTNTSSKPVYILVTSAESTTDLFSDPMAALKYFVKLPQGATSFSIELSGTGLIPGDKVMIIALWDRDYLAGFPSPSDGDMIGYYIDQADYDFRFSLTAGVNTPVILNINKTYKLNDSSVSGNVLGSESGEVILIAYNGEFNSLDAKLDTDKIIAYKKITKGTGPAAYSMDLLPWNTFPVQNVFIFAILDKNSNGIPDSGDRIGFYSADSQTGIPSVINLQDDVNSGYDVQFLLDYIDPSAGGTPITLHGHITPPSGYTTSVSTKPVYIIVAKAENSFDLIGNPMGSMKYFLKMPQGAAEYNITLTGCGLNPGDEIRILALWDRNYTAGFPNPENGDKVGYYQNNGSFSFSRILSAGANYADLTNGWSFRIDKTIFKNNAQFRFNFNQSVSGSLPSAQIIGQDLIVVMVHEDGVRTSDMSYSITDMNYIISIDYVKNIPNLNDSYTLYMFPFLYDSIERKTSSPASVGGVYVYVILDSNSNGCPDSGEYLGYYWSWVYGDLLHLLGTVPMRYSTIYYDRINDLNTTGEKVTIFRNRTY